MNANKLETKKNMGVYLRSFAIYVGTRSAVSLLHNSKFLVRYSIFVIQHTVFCRFSLPFQTKIKNAFPGTMAGKGVLCVTNTVKLKVKLGVFWLGLAWLARNVPFVYPLQFI